MAETAQQLVERILREFKRYAGDGQLPAVIGELPIGDPASGVHNPKKAELRAALLAVLRANSSIVQVVKTGGTANALQVAAAEGINVDQALIYFYVVDEENTGPVTLEFPDAEPVEVLNTAGNPLSAGEWTGVVLFVLNDDGDYQLIIDAGAAVSAAQSASEAAADAGIAETARDEALSAAGEATGRALIYPGTGPEVYNAGDRKIGSLADATEDQDAVNRRTALSLIGATAITINPQSFLAEEQAQARENAGLSYAQIAKLMAPYRKITEGDHTRHKGFPAVDVLPSGRIVVCYRDGPEHVNLTDESSIMSIYSDDGGLEWSEPITVAEQAGHTFLNYASGVMDDGTMVVISEDLVLASLPSSGKGVKVFKTTDGITWTAGLSSTPGSTRLIPYGKMIKHGGVSGEYYFRCYLFANQTPDSPVNYDQMRYTSDDGFETAATTVIYDNALPSTSFNPSEAYTVRIDDLNHFAMIRREQAGDDKPLFQKSSDGGYVWSGLVTAALQVGKNPPTLWYDDIQELLYAFWPSRGGSLLSDGNTWKFQPWFYSTISKENILSSTPDDWTKWRPQTPLPIFTTKVSGPGVVGAEGDSGTGHVFEAHGMKFLVYYNGGNYEDFGASVYVANLTSVLGI